MKLELITESCFPTDLLGGGGGGSSQDGLQNLLGTIQSLAGGKLPTNVGNLLPGIMKVAEIIGHGVS